MLLCLAFSLISGVQLSDREGFFQVLVISSPDFVIMVTVLAQGMRIC